MTCFTRARPLMLKCLLLRPSHRSISPSRSDAQHSFRDASSGIHLWVASSSWSRGLHRTTAQTVWGCTAGNGTPIQPPLRGCAKAIPALEFGLRATLEIKRRHVGGGNRTASIAIEPSRSASIGTSRRCLTPRVKTCIGENGNLRGRCEEDTAAQVLTKINKSPHFRNALSELI